MCRRDLHPIGPDHRSAVTRTVSSTRSSHAFNQRGLLTLAHLPLVGPPLTDPFFVRMGERKLGRDRTRPHELGALSCSSSCSKPRLCTGSKPGQQAFAMPPIDLKALENRLGGRDRLDFGTVRPRVQIPGPRPPTHSNDDRPGGFPFRRSSWGAHRVARHQLKELRHGPAMGRRSADSLPAVNEH
jgi:hypothetical protein